ncbi:Ig-like domain-containing protein [Paenibacillus sp. WQ 127069]|uniref:Ig-like domain-containing protein n=1 Tax=Paenibacillus baimaensis TaxID=2982185 RepID=A0ABT2U9K3_9BACL|nr:Ig-like domain-containing protein [Paenibacillus sp. WQ 127069]
MNKMLVRLVSVFLVLSLLLGSGFTLISERQVAYASALTIEQITVGNIFYENDTKSFKINTDGDSIDWVYSDYWDHIVQSGSQAVSGGSVLLTVNPGKKGWFNLVVTAKQNGNIIATKDTSFAVVSNFDLSQVVDSHFSVQTHAARTDLIAQDSAALIPIARKMGVKYIRDALRWGDIEDTTKGIYNFKAYHDDFMSRVASNDLKPYMTLALYNDLYDGGNAPTSPEARAAFAEYGKQLLSRYPEVGQVEIWNEPDIPSFGKGLSTEAEKADFYYNLLKTSYEQIHPLYPNVKITGFVFGEMGSDAFLEALYQKGALNYLDEYSFHSYTRNPEDFVKDINRHKNIMKTYNNNQTVPINLSETGFSNFNFDEHVQANYVARRIVTALANGIQKINIYNLQNKSTVPGEFEGTFGLIRNPDDAKGAYVPKPAYAAYATMTRELTGADFQATEEVFPGIYIHRFHKGTEDIRVMYAPTGADLKLYTHDSLDVTDIMGNTHALTPTNGYVQIRLDENPIYVKGGLEAPYIEEIPPSSTDPITLYTGYSTGGYTEVNGPLGTATNKWVTSSVLKGYNGGISRAITIPTGASAKWTPTVPQTGQYRISTYLPGTPAAPVNTTKTAAYSIYINGVKQETKTVDQFSLQGSWQVLGSYQLPRGANSYILLEDGNPAHDRPLRADVIRLEMIPPTGIALDTGSLNLRVGDTHTFTAVFTPAEATDRTLVWTSSDNQVATVDAEGQVNAAGAGEAVIRVTNPLTSLYAEARIQVTIPPIERVTIYNSYGTNGGYTEVNGPLGTATNKWVTSTVLQGYSGGISRAITNPTGASAKWTPTIVQPGRYRVSVYLPGTPAAPVYTTKAAEYSIYIDGVKTDSKIVDSYTLQGSWQLLGIYDMPRGSTSYIIVEDANSAHDRPLRADAAKFEFIPATGISLDTQTLNVLIGDTHQFTAGITPNDSTDQALLWSSSNSEVAAIDAQGHLRALAVGSTVIRVSNPLTSLYAEAEVKVTQVDKTAPTTTDNAPAGWVNHDVTVSLNASDSESGVAAVYYTVDGGAQQTGTTVTLTSEGVHTLSFWSVDNAGNIESQHMTIIKIDKTPPAEAALTADKTAPTATDVTVTISYPADAMEKVYKVGANGTWAAYLTPVVVSENGTVYARGTDAAGNLSNETSYVISNIDKVIPTATIAYSTTTTTTQAVYATLTPNKPVTITNNGGLSSYTFYYNGSFTFEFVDSHGMKGTATAIVNNILSNSKAKPGVITLSDDNGYDTGIQDGSYQITMNMWYGENGSLYKLYENDALIDTKVVADNSPHAQAVTTRIHEKKNGTYRYYAELINAYGTTTSGTHVVTVSKAAPDKPILSADKWDGDGNFKVSMNLWWGTNGTTYHLYENGVLIYTKAMRNHTPSAQSAVTAITNKIKGSYEYRGELVNYAGATSSDTIIVQVTH